VPTLLVKGAALVVSMDAALGDIPDGAVFCRDGIIEQIGPAPALPTQADEVLDLAGHIVIPGLVNTHHHLFQNLTRAVPAAQNASLFTWLKELLPIWSNMGPDHVYVSALVGLAEMALTGCTTSSDHLYLFPNGARLDDAIRAAQEILKDTIRLIETYHDERRYSMLRIVVAPCSPFTVSRELMRESAVLARQYGVSLHTHTAEDKDDVGYSLEKFGLRPGDYAQSVGWMGPDVWHAHCVQLDADEIALFGRTGTGVAHCPSSNMRLASGIAPVRRMLDARVPVGLGVDGSASNDSGHLLNEARQALLVQRLREGAAGLTARMALEIATRGGARVIGRDDIGTLAPGMAADLAAFRLDTIDMAGGQWDPAAALLFCGPQKASATIVNGRIIVRNGHLVSFDLAPVLARHASLVRSLANGVPSI
jgi:8-oxoguanine deaminase